MTLPYTTVFVAIFVLMSVPMAIAVGLRRAKTGILLLHGEDEDLLKRMRAHGNFTEFVPLALLALAAAELSGAAPGLLIGAGCVLIVARLMHYATMRRSAGGVGRFLGAGLTSLTMVVLALVVLAQAAGLV